MKKRTAKKLIRLLDNPSKIKNSKGLTVSLKFRFCLATAQRQSLKKATLFKN